jgi:uncharacterized Ntn-hydrolase superfamily protein
VPWGKAGVGAIATQAWVNKDYGITGLEMLESGMTPQEVIDSLKAIDPGYERRQIGIVDYKGNAATYTGPGCLSWAGGAVGRNCAAQGNILASDSVISEMISTFEKKRGTLADKLMAALLAGEKFGGDSRGKQSAALYVVEEVEGHRYDRKIDVRVDDHDQPFRELKRIYNISKSLSYLDAAAVYYQDGDLVRAVKSARKAVESGPTIPETYYDLACYLTLAGEFEQALASVEAALEMDPGLKSLAREDSDLDGLRTLDEFQNMLR